MTHEQRPSIDDDKTIRGKDGSQLSNRAQLARSRACSKSEKTFFSSRRTLGDSRDSATDGASETRACSESKDASQSTILNPRLWPSVEYGKRNLLPAIAGVYCVMSSGGNPLYIGQSMNICQRWKGHHLRRQLKTGASLRIAWRETFSEMGRLKMEALLIRRHQPKLNVNFLPCLTRPTPNAAMIRFDVKKDWLTTGQAAERMVTTKEALSMLSTRMAKELTSSQVAERLGVAHSTVRAWCNRGLFSNATRHETPAGSYWTIPESDLKSFQQPQQGRPPKTQPGTKRGRKAA